MDNIINKQINTMEQLNALAQILFGKFGFTTCTEEQMEYIITNYYILK
jgi:hypothetical protein